MMQRWQMNTGFTILEMLIVIAILGIVTAIAAPSMQRQIALMKIKNTANLLESSFKQARSDALIYRSDISATVTGQRVTLTQAGNPNYVSPKDFDANITVSAASLTFTPSKTVTASATVGICYTGISTKKYEVKVDKIANIDMSESSEVCP